MKIPHNKIKISLKIIRKIKKEIKKKINISQTAIHLKIEDISY